MTNPLRLGMLTPSSNTILAPVTSAMLAGMPEATAHFGRFRVTEISLSDQALAQFDLEPMLTAADLPDNTVYFRRRTDEKPEYSWPDQQLTRGAKAPVHPY